MFKGSSFVIPVLLLMSGVAAAQAASTIASPQLALEPSQTATLASEVSAGGPPSPCPKGSKESLLSCQIVGAKPGQTELIVDCIDVNAMPPEVGFLQIGTGDKTTYFGPSEILDDGSLCFPGGSPSVPPGSELSQKVCVSNQCDTVSGDTPIVGTPISPEQTSN